MKSSFGFLSLGFILATAASSAAATEPKTLSATETERTAHAAVATESDNGGTLTVTAGDELQVRVTDHGDGGYVWALVSSGGLGGGAKTHRAGSGALGDFGTDVFTFATESLPPGNYEVELACKRPFGTDPAISFALKVTVVARSGA